MQLKILVVLMSLNNYYLCPKYGFNLILKEQNFFGENIICVSTRSKLHE